MGIIISTATRRTVDTCLEVLKYEVQTLCPLVIYGLYNLTIGTYRHKYKHKLINLCSNNHKNSNNNNNNSNWSMHLSQDIMEEILQRLCLNDYLRVGTVCSSWRSTVARVITEKRYPPAPQLPRLLMFITLQPNPLTNWVQDHTLLNLFDDGGRSVSPSCHANLFGQYCYGSIEGWLMITDAFLGRHSDNSLDFLLSPHIFSRYRSGKINNLFFNPVSRAKVLLPSQLTIPCSESNCILFLRKAVASSVPNSPNCIVAAISRKGDLAFCRPCHKTWTLLYKSDNNVVGGLEYMEIAIHDGKLYALTSDVHQFIMVFDLLSDNPSTKLTKVIEMNSPQVVDVATELWDMHERRVIGSKISCFYLVTDLYLNELLLIVQIDETMRDYSFKAKEFEVFRLDQSGSGGLRWLHLDTLGDRILFISHNSCMCISASATKDNSEKELLVRGNCIYYAFDYDCITSRYLPGQVRDVGVYSLADARVKRNVLQIFRSFATRPPIWFTPNAW